MNLGTRIRILREDLGLSRKELAHGIVSYSHMSNIESGRFVPGDDVLRLLAKKLQVPEDYLLLHNEKNENLENLLDEINEALEVQEDTDRARRLFNHIEEQYGERINSTEQEVYFYLLKCHYYNMDSQLKHEKCVYVEKCVPLINDKDNDINDLPVKVVSKYFFVTHLYYFSIGDYLSCYKYTSKHLENCNTMDQKADAYYYIGRVQGRLNYFNNAIGLMSRIRTS